MFEKTKTRVDSKKVITKGIDENRNLVDKEQTMFCVVEQVNNCGNLIVTNNYLSLMRIDDDYYSYGTLEVNPEIIYAKNEKLYEKKFGILKLNRDAYSRVIPFHEKIIVPPVYDEIVPKNSNTVSVKLDQKCTYFDLLKEKQLTPVVLDLTTGFDLEYPGFAYCFYDFKAGYLPRNIKPVMKKDDINLLSGHEVEILIKYQKDTDLFSESNKKYIELTGKSYTK